MGGIDEAGGFVDGGVADGYDGGPGCGSAATVSFGKGGKAREAKLSPTLYAWLRQYWARERPPRPFLFTSGKTGKRACAESVRAALADAAKKA